MNIVRTNTPRADRAAVDRLAEFGVATVHKMRERLKAGELGLDIYRMREKLASLGLVYRDDSAEE
jgi:4-hydroxy-4-methyl-2-oxoglutarate aldolase